MSLSEEIQYLSDEVDRLNQLHGHMRQQMAHLLDTNTVLETVVHKAAQIAQHLPYLIESLPEPSAELLQAALQLQTILVQRKP